MAANDIIARLGGWAGYEVDQSWEEQRGSGRWCVIRLRAAPTARRRCSRCGEVCSLIHDCEARRVRAICRSSRCRWSAARSSSDWSGWKAIRG